MTTQTIKDILAGLSPEDLALLQGQLQNSQIQFDDTKDNGRPLSTLANFEQLLQYYNITIRHNEMTKQTEIDIPGRQFHRDTEQNAKISWLVSLANKQNLPDKHIVNYITLVANANAYHPVRDWIETHTWDGQDRIQQWIDSVVLDIEHPLKTVMMRKWVLSAVAALYHQDFSCEGVLTWQSSQGRGKTISIQSLLPRDKHTKWTKDGVVVDTKNKDSLMKALGYWITEMGEIDATFRKSDMEALKAFITERADEIRPPYERTANLYPRRTVFYGSVNELEFLQDSENRRFWVLSVERFNPIDIDVGQFWAQVRHLYDTVKDKIGSKSDRELHNEWGWFLSPDERAVLQKHQNVFKSIDPIEETLENCVMTRMPGTAWMNCTAILNECGKLNPSRRDTNIAAKWLRANGFRANGMKQYCVTIMRPDHTGQFEPIATPVKVTKNIERDY